MQPCVALRNHGFDEVGSCTRQRHSFCPDGFLVEHWGYQRPMLPDPPGRKLSVFLAFLLPSTRSATYLLTYLHLPTSTTHLQVSTGPSGPTPSQCPTTTLVGVSFLNELSIPTLPWSTTSTADPQTPRPSQICPNTGNRRRSTGASTAGSTYATRSSNVPTMNPRQNTKAR